MQRGAREAARRGQAGHTMSLTVSIRPELGMEAVPHLCLEDDGYYWFLHPWLESLREQTGK